MEDRMTTLPLERGHVLTADDDLALRRREFLGIYHQTWSDVFRYAFVLLRHREDAEDVASEAYRRALESWDSGRGPDGEPLPWLFLITRRIVIDRHRRRRLIGWLPLERVSEPEDHSEEAAFRRSEVWIWFEQLCRVLPDQQREALFLRFQFDLSDAEAGKVMATSAGNVRTLVSRGLAALRQRPEVMDR
jgi:RNA polymerase sigma-70 factor (ECF subfamily)